MKTNKMVLLIFCVFVLFLVTSCFEVVHSVESEKGKLKTNYQLVIKKAIIEMAEIEIDDILDELGQPELFDEVKHEETIDNETEFGFRFSFNADTKSKNESMANSSPFKKGNTLTIPLISLWEDLEEAKIFDPDTVDEDMRSAEIIFSFAKYNIILGKSVVKNIKSADLVDKKGRKTPLRVFDAGDSFLVSFPTTWLLTIGKEYSHISIKSK